MIAITQVTVTDTATLLYTAVGKTKVRLQPSVAFYLGEDASVTTGNGYSVTGGAPSFDRVFEMEAGDSLYGIAPVSASSDVRVLAVS
jgi:hypothetical protein